MLIKVKIFTKILAKYCNTQMQISTHNYEQIKKNRIHSPGILCHAIKPDKYVLTRDEDTDPTLIRNEKNIYLYFR